MSDEITPALTAEEWTWPQSFITTSPKMGIFGRVVVEDGVLEIQPPHAHCAGWDGRTLRVEEPEDRHALAALCLYGQPFGFTREDVRVTLELAEACGGEADVSEENARRLGADPQTGHDPKDIRLWQMDAGVNRRRAQSLKFLAARIAALLPPEDGK